MDKSTKKQIRPESYWMYLWSFILSIISLLNNLRAVNEEYCKWVQPVGHRLLSLLSLGLGLEKNELKENVGGDELKYLLKINYYPPCPRPDLALGVVAHTDMSSITILVPNEVQGLQVFRDDHWFDVKYIPDALVIHIGDQLEVRLSFFPSHTIS